MTSSDPLEQIANRAIAPSALQSAMARLGSVTEPPSFWLDILNDETYSAAHRARALCQLFRRHVRLPVNVVELAAFLRHPAWINARTVRAVKHLKGEIPVEWNPGETVLALRIEAPRTEAVPVLYLRLSASVEAEAFVGTMRTSPAGPADAGTRILEAACSSME